MDKPYPGSHLSWRYHIDALAKRHRVLALDWFGWGASSRRVDLPYDYDTEVERLGAVLDALGIDECNLIAHDYGGFLGLGFCERHPERVRRLALLNTRAHRSFTPGWYLTTWLMGVTARLPVVGSLARCLPLVAIHRAMFRHELSASVWDARIFDAYVGWMGRDPNGARFLLRFFADYDVRVRPALGEGLSAITCPTAIVWGRRDPFLPLATARELAARIRGATLTLVDAAHFVMEEQPREVERGFEDLLARAVTRRPRGAHSAG